MPKDYCYCPGCGLEIKIIKTGSDRDWCVVRFECATFYYVEEKAGAETQEGLSRQDDGASGVHARVHEKEASEGQGER